MGEPRGHPRELLRERQGRQWPKLLAAVLVLLLAGAVSVGLPGSGQLQITVRIAGGPGVLPRNAGSAGGHIEIQQLGRTVRTLTLLPGLSRPVRLRPGLYQVLVKNVPGCGGNSLVLWGALEEVDITCSVK